MLFRGVSERSDWSAASSVWNSNSVSADFAIAWISPTSVNFSLKLHTVQRGQSSSFMPRHKDLPTVPTSVWLNLTPIFSGGNDKSPITWNVSHHKVTICMKIQTYTKEIRLLQLIGKMQILQENESKVEWNDTVRNSPLQEAMEILFLQVLRSKSGTKCLGRK